MPLEMPLRLRSGLGLTTAPAQSYIKLTYPKRGPIDLMRGSGIFPHLIGISNG